MNRVYPASSLTDAEAHGVKVRFGLDRAAVLPVLFVALMNVGVLTVTWLMGSARSAWYDLDYAVVPAVVWLLARRGAPRRMQLISAVVATQPVIAADALSICATVYGWEPGILYDYLGGASDWPWRLIVPAGILLFAASVPLVAILTSKATPQLRLVPLVAISLFLYDVDIVSGRGPLRLDTYYLPNIVFSAANQVLIPALIKAVSPPASLTPWAGSSMARTIEGDAPPPPQILSVALESWGELLEGASQDAVLDALRGPVADDYLVTRSTHGFAGGTLSGELRELCAMSGSGTPSAPNQLSAMRDCLPARLARLGYATHSLHGNGSSIYNRRAIYPAMGFKHRWFFGDLSARGAEVCEVSMFAGSCDRDVYRQAIQLFDDSRRFVHVMTLNTHLPLPRSYGNACLHRFNDDQNLCRYSIAMRQTLNQLGWELHRAKFKPDLVIIYGDHMPPFFSKATRSRFSSQEVPYIVLTRKDAAKTARCRPLRTGNGATAD